jgi:23S rRNA pseudouridine2604 synthase
MRLNKYLAQQGVATRRDADALIAKRRVLVNGRVAELGTKVEEGDEVRVAGNDKPKQLVYVLFNKPAGVDTHAEGRGEDALSMLPPALRAFRLFPVGRLDKASSGLMLLTNDGRVTDRLLNPEKEHEKEYDVTTKAPMRPAFKERAAEGIVIEGYASKPAKVVVVSPTRFRITLTEGKKHQIRRMVAALGGEVKSLERTRIGVLSLEGIARGKYRILERDEQERFLRSLGLAA